MKRYRYIDGEGRLKPDCYEDIHIHLLMEIRTLLEEILQSDKEDKQT